jgi:hypothetical protein
MDTEAGTTYVALVNPQPEAIVVYCSDPRLQQAFDEFIAGELGLAKGCFIPLVVAGGAGVLANPERLPKEFRFLKERFELFCSQFSSIKRIVLINHEDCKYYESLGQRVLGLLQGRCAFADLPREDLKSIANIFVRLLSHLGVGVELYYARFADKDHSRVTFEKVI